MVSTTPSNSPKIASPDLGSSGWFLFWYELEQSWICCWTCFNLAPIISLFNSVFLLRFTFANIAPPIPPQNRSSKPSILVSGELVMVFLSKLKRSNRQLKRILNNRFDLSKTSSSIPKVVLPKYMNHYSFGLLINWWLSVRLCCIFFKKNLCFVRFDIPLKIQLLCRL